MARFQPVIKWSGSKRNQAEIIAAEIPPFHRYFEPFVGGGSLLYAVAPVSGIAGDVCEPLISLWRAIQSEPDRLAKEYEANWRLLQSEGADYYYVVRERFNEHFRPEDLLFLSRTCVNGLIRFNSKGEFNNSFHLSRPGINPARLRNILVDWSARVQGLRFEHGDYRDTTRDATDADFIYLDPPYMNTKGRYYGTDTIDFDEFFAFLDLLNSKKIKWALSFDGTRGDITYTHSLPDELYSRHILIPSGTSTFRRVIDGTLEDVNESLFLNF